MKVKDAIVDQFRDKFGSRPDVQNNNPDLRIHIHHTNRPQIFPTTASADRPVERNNGCKRIEFFAIPIGDVSIDHIRRFSELQRFEYRHKIFRTWWWRTSELAAQQD